MPARLLRASEFRAALQPAFDVAESSNQACLSPMPLVFTVVNQKYSHVLANFIAHLHALDCIPPTELHCTDDASFSLCDRLVFDDNIRCVRSACEDCHKRQSIAFMKFYIMQKILHDQAKKGPVLYLDGTSLFQGQMCLAELMNNPADVIASAELMSPGCPRVKLAPEVRRASAPPPLLAVSLLSSLHARAPSLTRSPSLLIVPARGILLRRSAAPAWAPTPASSSSGARRWRGRCSTRCYMCMSRQRSWTR